MSALRNRRRFGHQLRLYRPSRYSLTSSRQRSDSGPEQPPEDLANFNVIKSIPGKDQPGIRSGHRVFITNDFLYAMGGFDNTGGHGFVYKDMWRMNLITHVWERLRVEDENTFPQAQASFAIAQTAPYSNEIIFFGGTAIPFGESTSSDAFLLTIDPETATVRSEKIDVKENTRAVYGHALIRNNDPYNSKFYSVGGTSGFEFFLDVNCLRKDEDGSWTWSKEGDTQGDGLYRMEGVFEDDLIILLGGGTPSMVKDFQCLTVFNTVTKQYEEIRTNPDMNEVLQDSDGLDHDEMHRRGFPKPRRCHSVTRWERKLIVAGGCSEDIADGRRIWKHVYGDVWILDLDTFTWTKYPHDLEIPVFFHSAEISKDGCLYIFGGVIDKHNKNRVNICQAMWMQPPPLLFFASRVVHNATKKAFRSRKRSISSQLPPPIISAAIEEDHRQKSVLTPTDDNRANTVAPNLPLSCFQRVFPVPYRPNPAPLKQYKISFCHYKRRLNGNGPVKNANSENGPGTSSPEDEHSNDGSQVVNQMIQEDLEECGPSDPEMRYRCSYMDCGKRYKNANGLKNHMRQTHGMTVTEDGVHTIAPDANIPGNGIPPQPPSANASPTKYAASRPHKCQHCPKRYKTPTGLQNHVTTSHQKPHGNGQPQPSPQTIAQIILKQSQMEQKTTPNAPSPNPLNPVHSQPAAAPPMPPQRPPPPPLPVSVASHIQSPQYQNPPQPQHQMSTTHLPVRSIPLSRHQQSIPPPSHQPIMTTGQLLQQQYLQRRNQQMQQQNMPPAVSYAHQSAPQPNMVMNYPASEEQQTQGQPHFVHQQTPLQSQQPPVVAEQMHEPMPVQQ